MQYMSVSCYIKHQQKVAAWKLDHSTSEISDDVKQYKTKCNEVRNAERTENGRWLKDHARTRSIITENVKQRKIYGDTIKG